MNQEFIDKMLIREQIERWTIYRDSLDWPKFRTVWDKCGRMKATWTEGSFEDFIAITEEGLKHGLNIMHNLGGSNIIVKGDRAFAMSRMTILQRAMVEGILCDLSGTSRQYDLWLKRDGKWGLYFRETICDKDRLDPVDNTQKVHLRQDIIDKFPTEYTYLAYLQSTIGYNVDTDVPRLSGGPSMEKLFKRADDWLNCIENPSA